MWEAMIQFWQANSANIIVSLLIGVVFFVLGPMGLWFSGKKIRRERIRKAREALIDLLEGIVVNQAKVDEAKLKSVFRAVERDVDIELSDEYQIDHWLDDVVLRFEKSRHLSADQKQEYYNAVRTISDDIHAKADQKPRVEVPRKYDVVLNELKAALRSNNSSLAATIVEEFEGALAQKERSQDPLLNVFRIYSRIYRRNPFTFILSTIIGVILYFFTLFKFMM